MVHQVDPELWKAGETQYIPRAAGPGYFCLIYQTTPSVVFFQGPTGKVESITRELLRQLIVRPKTEQD